MPEHIRTLMVLLVLASAVFAFAKAPVGSLAFAPEDFVRRRKLWFWITLAAFLAHNFWLYMMIAGTLLFFAARREHNKLALYFLLLFAVPPYRSEIWGMGVMNFLFAIDHPRLLALMVLLPTYLFLRKQQGIERFGAKWPDKFLAGYLILQFSLILPASTMTNAFRVGVFYPFVDVFLPYYVASRSLRDLKDFREALMAFAIAALLLSAIGVFEYARHWLIYSPLKDALDVRSKLVSYLGRGDDLRAVGSPGDAIVLGYVIAIGMSFFLYLKKSITDSRLWTLGMGLLIAGLISPLSRGPWLGAAVMVLMFVLTGPNRARGLTRMFLFAALALPIAMATPVGDKILDYLPWIGTAETKTVDFRANLLERAISVILVNPYFGSFDYIGASEFQDLATGSGFIDIVNTYVGVALARGLVGLSLFVGVFAVTIYQIIKAMRRLADRGDERYLLGQALFAALIGILVIIGTVSSVSVVPVVYWCVAGLGVGYVRMLKNDSVLVVPTTAAKTRTA
jgi:hypothetical protein